MMNVSSGGAHGTGAVSDPPLLCVNTSVVSVLHMVWIVIGG